VEPSDEQLMRGAAGGDAEAFGALYDRHAPRLLAFLTRFLGDRAMAEDVTQDAFWKVWENRNAFDPKRQTFRVFLYVVARNLARNEQGRAGRRRDVPLTEDGDAAGPSGDEPARLTERRFLRESVRAALLELPEEQRLCVVLREYEGYSFREAARILGCSEVRARVLAFRARARLKRLLAHLMEAETRHVESQF
jgi:RNA polymerase sigma-70 factor, ECF subfamily